MSWGKSSDQNEHQRRSRALTANYESPAGMPVYDRSRMGLGSRGGAPIWVMREAFRPPGHLKSNAREDPDGFAVFGRYPHGFLDHVIKQQLLGDVRRDEILYVCSGTLGPAEKWTCDVRREARPLVQASGTALPFRDASFAAVMLDPPYSDQYARNLYGTENPRPSWLLREAARVVRPSGRIGMLHIAVPFAPPGCRLIQVYGVSTGVGFRIRAFTVYERAQSDLPFGETK